MTNDTMDATWLQLCANLTSEPPPTHLLSDYIEISYLAIVIAVGTPLNLFVLVRLIIERRMTPKNDQLKAGYILMKINLNLSDLLILLVHSVGKMAWLATYSWEAGDLMCKLYEFLTMVALYISSNVVVCIALDRLRNVLSVEKKKSGGARAVRTMLVVSWVMAIVWSLPQVHIWKTFDVFPCWPGGWHQCTDMWMIQRHQFPNDTLAGENEYQMAHLILVFWGPLVVLFCAYVVIAVRLLHYAMRPASSVTQNHQRTRSVSTSQAEMTVLTPKNSAVPTPITASPSLVPHAERVALCQMGDTVSVSLSPSHAERHPRFFAKRSLGTLEEMSSTSDGKPPCLTLLLNDKAMVEDVPPKKKRSIFGGSRSRSDSEKTRRRQRQRCQSTEDYTADATKGFRRFSRRFSAMLSSVGRRTSGRSVPPRPRLPAWRQQLRSKVFRTTLLVVLTHVLLWMPYNVYALSKHVSPTMHTALNDHANIFKDLQIIITLINPFLYGFTQ